MPPPEERRDPYRRGRDQEAYNLAQEANERSHKSWNAIDKHIDLCEQQNTTVLNRLDKQDRMLNWLVGLAVTGLAGAAFELLLQRLPH